MKTTVGIIGLGKMGGNLALQAIEKGYTIIGMSKHHKQDLEQQHLVQVKMQKTWLPNFLLQELFCSCCLPEKQWMK